MAVWASCRRAAPPERSRVFPGEMREGFWSLKLVEAWCCVCLVLDTLEAMILGYAWVCTCNWAWSWVNNASEMWQWSERCWRRRKKQDLWYWIQGNPVNIAPRACLKLMPCVLLKMDYMIMGYRFWVVPYRLCRFRELPQSSRQLLATLFIH